MERQEEQIDTLQSRIQDLLDEVEGVGKELEKKTDELKTFSKKTDEYIRFVKKDHLWRESQRKYRVA